MTAVPQLQDPIAALVDAAALDLGGYIQTGRQRTDLLKRAAGTIVELRQQFTLEDGRTDWSGRSPRYRAAIAQVYFRAHVPDDKLDTVQAALRYHVGNVLRERAEADELAAVGLSATSPKARIDRIRAVTVALANEGKADPLRLTEAAETLLGRVSPEALVALGA